MHCFLILSYFSQGDVCEADCMDAHLFQWEYSLCFKSLTQTALYVGGFNEAWCLFRREDKEHSCDLFPSPAVATLTLSRGLLELAGVSSSILKCLKTLVQWIVLLAYQDLLQFRLEQSRGVDSLWSCNEYFHSRQLCFLPFCFSSSSCKLLYTIPLSFLRTWCGACCFLAFATASPEDSFHTSCTLLSTGTCRCSVLPMKSLLDEQDFSESYFFLFS